MMNGTYYVTIEIGESERAEAAIKGHSWEMLHCS